jgi:O-antigen/teichoic acid export membrane protein
MAEAGAPGLIARLWRRALPYGVKFGNVGISMAVSLLLARVGGPALLGSFAIAIQTAQIASVPLVMGRDQLVLRDVAASLRGGRRGDVRTRIGQALRGVSLAGLAGAVLFALAVLALDAAGVTLAGDPALLAGAGFVLANCLYLLGLGAVRGLGLTLRAQLYEGIYQLPLALILLWLLLQSQTISAVLAVGLATLFLLASMAVLFWQAHRHTRGWPADADAHAPFQWREGGPVMLAQLIVWAGQWLPLFLAGLLGSQAGAGSFRAAWQLAFPLLIIHTTTGATRSAAYAGDLSQGRPDLARQRLQRDRLLGAGMGLALALPLLIWPGPILTFLFGAAFAGTEDVVQAFAVIHLATLAMGPIGNLITMAGRTREQVPASLISLAVQLAVGLLGWAELGLMALVWGYAAAQAIRIGWGLTTVHRILAGGHPARDQS